MRPGLCAKASNPGILLDLGTVDRGLCGRFASRCNIRRSVPWSDGKGFSTPHHPTTTSWCEGFTAKQPNLSLQFAPLNQGKILMVLFLRKCFEAWPKLRYSHMLQQAELIDSRELGQQAEVELEMPGNHGRSDNLLMTDN